MVAGYEIKQANTAELKEVRKFDRAMEQFDKAHCRLGEAVVHVEQTFAPVLEPSKPCGVSDCEKEPVPPQSEFERFVVSTTARMHSIAQALDYICERSTV